MQIEGIEKFPRGPPVAETFQRRLLDAHILHFAEIPGVSFLKDPADGIVPKESHVRRRITGILQPPEDGAAHEQVGIHLTGSVHAKYILIRHKQSWVSRKRKEQKSIGMPSPSSSRSYSTKTLSPSIAAHDFP